MQTRSFAATGTAETTPTMIPTSTSPTDDVARQLRDMERQGGGMATFAHICAVLLLVAGSLGSLISISADAFRHFLTAAQAGRPDVPDLINAVVGVLLVLAGDAALLYAASMIRVLTSAQAPRSEITVHMWVMVGVSLLEAATYLYMAWLFDPPTNWLLWLIDIGRAIAWPLLCAYLSMARPIPVGPRDVAYQAALASGKGVVRDVAVIAADPSAPLERKVRIFRAASTMTPTDRAKFDGIIDALAPQEELPTQAEAPRGVAAPLHHHAQPALALPAPRHEPSQPDPEPEPPAPHDPSGVRTRVNAEQNGHDATRSNVRTLAPQPDPLDGWPPREHGLNIRKPKPKTPRSDTGRSAADQRELRARRIAAAEKILDQHPDTGPRELARRIAMATSRRCSESTAASIRATILAAKEGSTDPSMTAIPGTHQATH